MVPMKRSLVASLCILFCAALSLHSQVLPSAARGALAIDTGALGSVFQPDWNGFEVAAGPKRLYGVGAFADVRFSRWVQIEGEGRWLKFNKYCPGILPSGGPDPNSCISEETYLIGPRVPIIEFHGFTPYGKVLVGLGGGSILSSGHAFALAPGGGLDYRLSRRLGVRADFEYQRWRVNPAVTLWPYGVSQGVSYRVFGPH